MENSARIERIENGYLVIHDVQHKGKNGMGMDYETKKMFFDKVEKASTYLEKCMSLNSETMKKYRMEKLTTIPKEN